MKLSKKYDGMVRFANFCKNYNLCPRQVAELMVLVDRRSKTATKVCNETDFDQKLDDNARMVVETHAESMGLKVTWPGIYPDLEKEGWFIHLPW